MSSKEQFSRDLVKAYEKLRNSKNTYEVYERLEPSRGEGNYKLTFIAKKKGGFGFLRAVVDIAEAAIYGNIKGVFWRIARTTAERMEGPMLEPIKRDFKGYEVAIIFKRWSETVPKGYIETIGNTLTLPEDDEWIVYDIDIGKEMRIIIDFVKVKLEEVMESPQPSPEEPSIEEIPPPEPVEIKPIAPVKPVAVGPVIPPGFTNIVEEMAKRFYVNGSLRNVENGFEFDLVNPLDEFNIIAPVTIMINNSKIPPQNILIIKKGKKYNSLRISTSTPLSINKGDLITVRVMGGNLQPGVYKIKINAVVDGLGSVAIDVEDNI